MTHDILSQLVALSNHLGDPARDYAILGEGNTSAKVDDETFWVKASGSSLGTLDESGLVQVRFDRLFELLRSDDISDEAVKIGLNAARPNPNAYNGSPHQPSNLSATATGQRVGAVQGKSCQ